MPRNQERIRKAGKQVKSTAIGGSEMNLETRKAGANQEGRKAGKR
jgi:hypothetical protein